MASDSNPNLLYVGTYTRRGRSDGIAVYRHDPDTGALTLLHTVPETDPSFLAFDPNGRLLFAVSETQQYEGQPGGSVVSYRIDPQSGNLAPLSRQASGGGDPCHLCTDPTGRYLLVANHEDGNVAVLPIGADGRLQPRSDLRQHVGSGPGPTQTGPHAHFVTFDPTGRLVLVNDKGIDKIMLYELHGADGTLRPHDPPFASVHSRAAPRHLAFHPNGRYAYVNGEADLTVNVMTYDAERGALEEVQTLSTLPGGVANEGFSTAHILVGPDGRFVYVSNRGHDSIAIFAVDLGTGRLTPVGHEPTRGRTPRNFAIDPAGRYLYAANQGSDTIVQFRIEPETGRLAPTGRVTEVGAPVCLLFS
jgi:6-phosphogluconolactonase